MAWADNTFCEHGISFADECERCEIVGLQESLKWMKRKVARDEKRLAELEDKYTPEIVKKMRDA
jgi:hypothetical protein